jgi:Swt1-like HEPN
MIDRIDTKLAGFVYKGQISAHVIDTLITKEGAKSDSKYESIAAKVSLKLFDDQIVESATKMAAVYVAIASFENTVRDFISTRMLEVKGANWWDDPGVSTDVKKRAENRQKEEKLNRWHQSRGLSPLYFTELGDLPNIIHGHWVHFEALLPSIEWVRPIFKNLERSRNVIMHSGQLSMDDIERVGVSIRDWIRQVGG